MKLSTRLLYLALVTLLSTSTFAQSDPVQLTINVQQADSIIKVYADSSNFTILDLRTSGEFDSGYIEGAENMNFYDSNFDTNLNLLDRTKIYLIYCAGGGRSGSAFNKMKALEFENVYNMYGGINTWINAGFPIVKSTGIDNIISESTINTYPNPAHNHFIINTRGKAQLKSFAIFDLQGRTKTVELNPQNTQQTINCSEWPAGLYILKAITKNGESKTRRIIVE